MNKISVGIVSQTPPVRLIANHYGDRLKLSDLSKDEYSNTVGGVAPLITSELNELMRRGFVSNATWFSLNPGAPKSIELSEGVKSVSVYMEEGNSKLYTEFKEKVWKGIHNIRSDDFTVEEYLGYFRYNSKLASIILHDTEKIDLFEIHDFQQLLLGAMLGPAFPSILRWHAPFMPELLNSKIRKFIVNGMEGNDAVIVSTKRDLEGLIKAGFKGSAYQIYPHIDNTLWRKPGKARRSSFEHRFGIKDEHFLILNVARMDMIKSQDDLIKAFALVKDKRARLMLVGGSSFTSKELGHPKGRIWTHRLRSIARRLGVEDRVIFAGNLGHEDLECAYSRADLFVLPSKIEGFGLVVVESWLYGTPAIVSEGAGVSELIMNGLNGFTFAPGKYRDLAERIDNLIMDEKLANYMGDSARGIAKACYASNTSDLIASAYRKTIEGFG